MLFQINPVLILVPVKIIQSIAPPYVYDIIILYLLSAVHRIVRFESEITDLIQIDTGIKPETLCAYTGIESSFNVKAARIDS